MKGLKRYGKIILFDTLAVICFIGVALLGWLPGPGGIPLFLLGLSLLAVNHDWAERWLTTAKHKGVSFKKWLFPKNNLVRNAYDTVTVTVFFTCAYVLVNYETRYIQAGAVMAMMVSLFVFLINRDRFGSFAGMAKRLKKRFS